MVWICTLEVIIFKICKKVILMSMNFGHKSKKLSCVGDFRKLFHVFATIETCQGRIVTRFALNVNYLFQGFLSQFFCRHYFGLSVCKYFRAEVTVSLCGNYAKIFITYHFSVKLASNSLHLLDKALLCWFHVKSWIYGIFLGTKVGQFHTLWVFR